MSTKTSIKRIALVAVSALGFGLLSVVPASAAEVASADITAVTIAADTRVVRTGSAISLVASFTAAAAADDNETVLLKAQFASAPTATNLVFTDAGRSITTDDSGTETFSLSVAGSIASILSTPAASDAFGAAEQKPGSISFTPTVAGTYELVLWHDRDGDDFLDSTEDYDTETISAAGVPTTIAFTKYGSGTSVAAAAGTAGTNTSNHGALVRVKITDAAGLNTGLAAGEYIRITPSTATADVMALNGTAVTYTPGTTTYYDLTYGDFNTSGNAFVNLVDSAAGTTTFTLNGGGTAIASVSAATTVTYKTYDTDGNFSASPSNCTTTKGFEDNTAPDFFVPLTRTSSTLCALGGTDFTAEAYGAITVDDASGKITGVDGSVSYTNDLHYTEAVLTDADKKGSITISHTFTATNQTFEADALTSGTGPVGVYTSKGRTLDATSVSASPATVRAATSSTISITANVVDNFDEALEAAQVVMSVSGRNSTATATKNTDSLGNAVFTLTDAPAAGVTAVVDTVTFTAYYSAANDTGTASVTWGGYTITTLTLTSPGEDDVVAGTTATAINAAGGGATGTTGALSATVKDANGLVLAGVPVTFSITGTDCAIPSDVKTVYTSAAGVAASAFYGWTVGSCVVKAEAGALSATDTVYFKQENTAYARTISATATGNVVTATVKDRYGNGIKGVTVWATRTGGGYFGNGSSSSSGTTDVKGQVEFVIAPGDTATVVTVQPGSTTAASATFGQTADKAGEVAAVAVTASVAGTSAVREKGVGASLAPAGVNTATATVAAKGVDAATTAAEAASDAAAEAIDAANAATDAANLAAEAADAATVAAEEARDAADAATAAVEELATQVATLMAALKAQITTLANTVAKIAKKVKA